MKKLVIILMLSVVGCSPKADNEMKEICHEVININRGVVIRFEPVASEAEK